MSEESFRDVTINVNLSQFTKAVMAASAMIETTAEQYDDVSAEFSDGLLALCKEIKSHADYIYAGVIEPSETIQLTTKIGIKAEIDKLDDLIDAFEQVQKKKSSDKKGDSNE